MDLSGRVICLGTSPTLQRTMVFDTIRPGEANRAHEVHEHASGKAVNAARVLHLLGRSTLYIGQVGGDRGAFFRRDLDAAGVPHDLLDVGVETRLCVTVVSVKPHQATELIQETQTVAASVGKALLDRLRAHLADGAAGVVLAGSVAPGLPADFYAKAIRLAHAAGVKVVLDAQGESLARALEERPDVVKPNRAELAATVGTPVDSRRAMQAAMAAMLERGAGWVVCTRGRDGSSVAGRSDAGVCHWDVSTADVPVVNPVGSGDAYAAGLAAGLAQGVDLPDACRYAAACGAANAEHFRAGMLDPLRVAPLVADCVVRKV